MEDALEALEIWNALLRSTCPRKLVMITVPSMAQSKRPGSTAASGYPACIPKGVNAGWPDLHDQGIIVMRHSVFHKRNTVQPLAFPFQEVVYSLIGRSGVDASCSSCI